MKKSLPLCAVAVLLAALAASPEVLNAQNGNAPIAFKASGPPMAKGAPVKVGRNVNVTNAPGSQAETSVAVDPTDPKHVIVSVNDYACSLQECVPAYESHDGGLTFQSTYVSDWIGCLDNWSAFNSKGDAFVSYLCTNLTNEVHLAYRLKGQKEWTEIVFSGSTISTFPDRTMMVIDQSLKSKYKDSGYIGYDDAGAGNTPYVLYSRDGVHNWQRSAPTGAGQTIGVNVATGPDGSVYATWEDYGSRQILSAKSSNGGATFGQPNVVTNYRLDTTQFFFYLPPQDKRGVIPMPFTATAPLGARHMGRLYVSYFDQDPGGNNTNIYVRHSDNGGQTWSKEAKVNDDTNHAYHFHGAISVANDGMVAVSFYDTRRDSNGAKTDRYVSFSTDGGVTWSANTRVTSAQSDVKGRDYVQYGDYAGSSFGPDGVLHLTWTDARPGTTDEDMFSATVQ